METKVLKRLILGLSTITSNRMLIFDFNKQSDISDWEIMSDAVMGGQSGGKFYLNEEGNGVFKGTVSLENNGGFSSLRHCF